MIPEPRFSKATKAGLLIALVTMVYLFGFFPYATGYLLERVTVAQDMRMGYRRDGGEWGFGWFVLPAVALLGWVSRDRYRELEVRPSSLAGGFLLILGFALFFLGYKANEKYIGFASGQVLAAGIIVWFLGLNWLKKGLWLWLLLGMLWPWTFLITPIATPLQHVMVWFTKGYLNLFGDGAVKNGTQVITQTLDPTTGEPIRLNVAAACSGLRSLFALAMISLLMGYLSLKEDWKKLVLLMSVPLMAVLGNFVRMLLLYYGALAMGAEKAIGKGEHDPSGFHIGAGLVVFVVALSGLSGLVQLLKHGTAVLRRKKVRMRSIDNSGSRKEALEES